MTRNTRQPRRPHLAAACALSALVAAAALGCGKKGPPLPPIVRLPSPPEISANRRANGVDVHLTIPAANTDGSHPANISRVDVYAVTAPPTIGDAELLKRGQKIASLRVKTPRNPDDAAEAGDEDADVEPPEGTGLDQGARADVVEDLTTIAPATNPPPPKREKVTVRSPLVGAPAGVPARTYAAVGFNNRGRRGPISKRAAVPLVPAPPRVEPPQVSYDETAVTISWPAVTPPSPPAGPDLLPSRPLVDTTQPAFAYNVYDVSEQETRLTMMPTAEPEFMDHRITWGAKRCYVVRAAETIGGLTVEGDASEPRCVTLMDTFPPAVPKGLQSAPSAEAINLIWDPNTEKDLAGYIVLRGSSPQSLSPITPEPIRAPTYKDEVASGFHAYYAVEAVDTAGNVSEPSSPTEETAR